MAVLIVAFKDVLFDVVVGIAPPPPVVVVLPHLLAMLLLLPYIIKLKPRSDATINM